MPSKKWPAGFRGSGFRKTPPSPMASRPCRWKCSFASVAGMKCSPPPSRPIICPSPAPGATLLKERRAAEAEQIYRDDLARQPNNGWSLYGLAQSLHVQNKHAEAARIDARFAEVWKSADIKITSSCYCQP